MWVENEKYHLIKNNKFDDALNISRILREDKEDLIHKAVGWMLREIGKRDLSVEKAYLKANYKEMPRTMLRYAIEKFPEQERKLYLQGEVWEWPSTSTVTSLKNCLKIIKLGITHLQWINKKKHNLRKFSPSIIFQMEKDLK